MRENKWRREKVGLGFESQLLFIIHRPVTESFRVFFKAGLQHFVSSKFSLFFNICPSLCIYLYREHKEHTECSYPVSLVKYEPKGIKTNFIFSFILIKPWTSVEVIFLMCPADKLLPNPCAQALFLLINIAQAQL